MHPQFLCVFLCSCIHIRTIFNYDISHQSKVHYRVFGASECMAFSNKDVSGARLVPTI